MIHESPTQRAFVLAIEAQTQDANIQRFRRELDHVRQHGTNQEYSHLLIRVLRMVLERNAKVVALCAIALCAITFQPANAGELCSAGRACDDGDATYLTYTDLWWDLIAPHGVGDCDIAEVRPGEYLSVC